MRKTILFAFLFLALAPALVLAQTSNTSKASAGQFTTETDNFMSVVRWQSIPKDLLFVGLTTGSLEAGYGSDLSKNFYLGLYYSGFAFDTDPGTLTTTVDSTYILDNFIPVGETKVTAVTMDDDFQTWISNDFAVLAGFGKMGVKLFLDTYSYLRKDKYDLVTDITYDMTTTSDTALSYTYEDIVLTHADGSDSRSATYAADGTTLIGDDRAAYTDGLYSNSVLMAYATWGMVLPSGKATLRPVVTLGAGLRDEGSFKQAYSRYLQAIGSGFPDYDEVTEVDTADKTHWRMNRKAFAIEPTLGINIEMPLKADTVAFDFSYGLDLNLASNGYKGLDGEDAKASGYAYDYHDVAYAYDLAQTTTTDIRAYEIDETTYQQHDINLSAKYSKKLSDKVKLSGTAALPLTLSFRNSQVSGAATQVYTVVDNDDASNNYVTTTSKTYSRDSVKTDHAAVTPSLSAGLQWAAVKDFLTFNLGATASILSFTRDVITYTEPGFTEVRITTVDADGQVVESPTVNTLANTRTESQELTTDWGGLNTTVNGGFNLNLGTGISLDMDCSVSPTAIDAATFSLQLQIRR